MIQSKKYTCKTKHIYIKFHFIKHSRETGIIDLEHFSNKLMIPDVFTKPMPKPNIKLAIISSEIMVEYQSLNNLLQREKRTMNTILSTHTMKKLMMQTTANRKQTLCNLPFAQKSFFFFLT